MRKPTDVAIFINSFLIHLFRRNNPKKDSGENTEGACPLAETVDKIHKKMDLESKASVLPLHAAALWRLRVEKTTPMCFLDDITDI